MIDRLKKRFNELPPEKQKKVSQFMVIGLLIVLGLAGYYMQHGKKHVKKEPKGEFSDLNPNLGYLQKSLYYEVTDRVKKMDRRLTELQLQLKTLEEKLHEQEGMKLELQKRPRPSPKEKPTTFDALLKRRGRVENHPVEIKVPVPPHKESVPSGTGVKNKIPRVVGDIGSVTYEGGEAKGEVTHRKPSSGGKGKPKESSVYLPPSFMEADLISGFAAPTMEAAKSEPVRIFLRIRDLAVLPNEIKGDLKGCFAVAEAYGNLADERAHVRLLRLSCIARDGSSVIDEPIKGFVVDEDGRIGLKGRVVSKMGAMLARSVFAGFLQGFGEAYSASSYTQTTSGLGTMTTLNPDDAVKAGIGKGISGGAEQLSKFYLDLARQTFPVIEVGAGKRVTMVVDQGVDLAIREKCLGGKDGCSEKHGSVIYTLADF